MFNLLDSFSAQGISLIFLVLFELLVVGWIYGKNTDYQLSSPVSPVKRPRGLVRWV